MKLIIRVLSWLACLGARDKPHEPMMRFARAVVGTLAYWRGYTDAGLWRRFGFTIFAPPRHKRLLGRRE
jgi:hypothetical protein